MLICGGAGIAGEMKQRKDEEKKKKEINKHLMNDLLRKTPDLHNFNYKLMLLPMLLAFFQRNQTDQQPKITKNLTKHLTDCTETEEIHPMSCTWLSYYSYYHFLHLQFGRKNQEKLIKDFWTEGLC